MLWILSRSIAGSQQHAQAGLAGLTDETDLLFEIPPGTNDHATGLYCQYARVVSYPVSAQSHQFLHRTLG